MLAHSRVLAAYCAFALGLVLGCGGTAQQTVRPQVSETGQAGSIPRTGQGGSNVAVNEINKALSLSASQTGSTLDYRVGPDDLIQVTIYNIPEQEARSTPRTVMLRVSHQGIIVAPLIGAVNVKGKTIADVQEELAKRYTKYIRNPQVGVMITEYRQRVSVMGAVQKPGVFDLTGAKTVMDMLAMAGGVTERAGNQVHLYRQDEKGNRQSAVIDLLALANHANTIVPIDGGKEAQFINMPVQAGDVVNVPQAGTFFVDGAVAKPGSYPLVRNYTLSQALATAGGVDREVVDYSAVTINRRNGDKTEAIGVDLNAVMAGQQQDPQIQPDDVILVPMSGFKYFVKRFVGTIISGTALPALGGS